ncbi:MAG TPA: MFS transporter [Burkholderiales bacterium]|nr:MFS transporter [Burkholderiales bacterium]
METSVRSRFPEFEGLELTEQQMLAYDRYRFWRITVMAAVWYSFYYLGRLDWSFCIPWIISDLKITKFEAGMGATAILWAYALGVFISGRFADKYGARIMDTIGGIGTTIMNIVIAGLSNLNFILGALFVNGFIQGQAYASTNGMISQWYPKSRRGFATGIYATSMGISTLVVWVVTGYFVTNYGWRAAFTYPVLLFTLPLTIVMFLVVRSKPQDANFPPYKETLTESISAQAEHYTPEEIRGVRAWKILFTNWRFMLYAAASMLMHVGRYGLLTWIPLYYAETSGVAISKIPAATVALPLGIMVGPLAAGWIADRFFRAKRYQVANIYMGCFIVIMLTMAHFGIREIGLYATFALLVLGGFFALGAVGDLFAAACDFGGRKMAATAVGVIDLFNYIGAGLQGVVIGGLLQWTGNWPTVFYALCAATALGLILVNIVRE